MRRTLLAWLVFLGGLGAEIGIDYFLRMRDGDGDVKTGGIPEILWFGIPIILAAAATLLLWQGTRPLHPVWKRWVVVLVQAIVGCGIYLVGVLFYIVQGGIDSL